MSLSEMESREEIGRLGPTQRELRRLVSAAKKQLNDTNARGLSAESKLVHAYQAILICAKAALRANGYRVTAGKGEHFVTLQSLAHTVGSDARAIRYYQSLRKKRHDDLYDGTLRVSGKESDEAVGKAEELLKAIELYLRLNFKHLIGD